MENNIRKILWVSNQNMTFCYKTTQLVSYTSTRGHLESSFSGILWRPRSELYISIFLWNIRY